MNNKKNKEIIDISNQKYDKNKKMTMVYQIFFNDIGVSAFMSHTGKPSDVVTEELWNRFTLAYKEHTGITEEIDIDRITWYLQAVLHSPVRAELLLDILAVDKENIILSSQQVDKVYKYDVIDKMYIDTDINSDKVFPMSYTDILSDAQLVRDRYLISDSKKTIEKIKERYIKSAEES